MPINVSEALDSDTAEKITVERTAAGSYVDGIYQAGSASTFSALASVQQPTPQQLQILPENERVPDVRLFICNKPILSSRESGSGVADVLIYKGVRYKVISNGDWSAYGHNTVMAARV